MNDYYNSKFSNNGNDLQIGNQGINMSYPESQGLNFKDRRNEEQVLPQDDYYRDDISRNDLNYTQYTANSALSSSFDLEEKAQGVLYYNDCLIEAISAYVRKDIPALINSFRSALDVLESQKKTNYNSLISCKCNLGIAHFYNSQHDIAINYIQEALETFNNFQESPEYYDFDKQLLLLKCWCNLMIIKMTIGDEQGYKQVMFDLTQYLQKLIGEKKRTGITSCLYMLFRINNFEELTSDNIFSMSNDIEDVNRGCYYMVSGILLEITGSRQGGEALNCYKKAFDIFQNSQDDIFMLLDTRLIIAFLEENGMEQDQKDLDQFRRIYNILTNRDEIKKLNLNVLFQNFDHRMAISKHLARHMKKMDLGNKDQNIVFNSRLEQMKEEQSEIWKQAVRLNIRKSINSSNLLLKNQKNLSEEQVKSLRKGTEQLSIVLSMIEKENNHLIFEKMSKDPYTRQSVNKLRSSLKTITESINRFAFREVFKTLNWRKLKPLAFKNRFDELEKNSHLINRAVNIVRNGDFLDKFHFSTSGHHKQFFQLIEDTLRWTSKKSNITKIRACHTYHLSEIKGLVYGKVTKTFFKKKNKEKEPWLCFSIILKNRPFDLYCKEENIDMWVIGLSHLIKKYNPDAYVLRPGQYFWRKLKYVMIELVKMKLPPEALKKINGDISFIKAINIYSKLRYYANLGN